MVIYIVIVLSLLVNGLKSSKGLAWLGVLVFFFINIYIIYTHTYKKKAMKKQFTN